MAQDWDEEHLIEKILSGKESQINAAASEMCALSRNMTAKIVHIGGGQNADVQTTLNDTALVLINKVQNGSFDPEKASLKTLFHTIAKNKWLDELSRRNRLTGYESSLDNIPASLGKTLQSPIEEHLFTQEEREKIAMALRQLDPACRKLLQLKYMEGISLRAIAERLGITEGAVKKRHERCKKKLKKIFGQDPRIG